MRKIILVGLYLSLPICAANASSNPPASGTVTSVAPDLGASGGDSCGARDYRYLVGKSIEEAHSISGYDYRIISNASSQAPNPKRLTILVDGRSQIIRQVTCG